MSKNKSRTNSVQGLSQSHFDHLAPFNVHEVVQMVVVP